MTTKWNCLTDVILEEVSKILGDINYGLTGSEIGHLLAQSKIRDISPSQSKWKRLYEAFVVYQNENQCCNNILNFIAKTLAPAKYILINLMNLLIKKI